MYIKQVIIEGFKSYREQIALESFSPKVNCVVGANGSGKTNFCHAIQFVLSDFFQNPCSEGWHALLHEAAGDRVSSAFVEIVLAVGKKEVRLRRTIGLEKDEYFLDGKHITKTKLMNLLKSVGFSPLNPYYVVQHRKITSLTLMKDSERLNLLKEIGGAQVYEERRRKSFKILEETGTKKNQIIQVLRYLNERLQEVNVKKDELALYQALDKEMKLVKCVIYDKQIQDVRQDLAKIEEKQAEVSETSKKWYNDMLNAEEGTIYLGNELKDVTKELESLNKRKKIIEKRQTEAVEELTMLGHDAKDLKEKITGNIQAKKNAAEELELVEKNIQESKVELANISRSYSNKVMKEKEFTKRITESEEKLSILYHANRFPSKAARDEWLQKRIADLKTVLSSIQMQKLKLGEEKYRLTGELNGHSKSSESLTAKITSLESVISQQQLVDSGKDKLHDEQKSLCIKEIGLTYEIDELKAEVEKAEESLEHEIPGDVRRGLNSIEKICKEDRIYEVHGQIIELLTCDEKNFTVVEATAGNSLFHVIVKNDEESTTIIEHLNSKEGGRVTFIPLNKVKALQVTFPEDFDGIPLLEELAFKVEYTPAFSQVFARTVICKNLDVASRVAQDYGLDCITLEGDHVCEKGSMTGGFYDSRQSKLKFMNIIKQKKNSISLKETELKVVTTGLQEINQKIHDSVLKQQLIHKYQADNKSKLAQLKQDIANTDKQKHSISKELENKEMSLKDFQNRIEKINAIVQMNEAAMGTELIDHLRPGREETLSALKIEIKKLNETLVAHKKNRIETETEKAGKEDFLTTNLGRRKQELEAVISSVDADSLHVDAESKEQELNDAKLSVEFATEQLRRVSRSIEDQITRSNEIKDEIYGLKVKWDDYNREHQKAEKKLEELRSVKNKYSAKVNLYDKKIKELGGLSLCDSVNVDRYKQQNIEELKCTVEAKKNEMQVLGFVNNKAVDQFMDLKEQQDELTQRLAELDAGDKKIRDLISVLDTRRDQSIKDTFKSVASHFEEVFSELVQGGHGHLVMMTEKGGPCEADPEGREEKCIGLKVKVSFTGQGERQSITQLSRSQKTVVALSLIFAMQRCDPAPFYLFDEIDAALDPQYKTTVGNMIRRLADRENKQFITTTFCPELVEVADKIYEVTHKNRINRVNVVSKKDALLYIEHDQTHNA